MRKVVIVAGCESYRMGDYLAAASLLRLEAVVATDADSPISDGASHIEVDLAMTDDAAQRIATTAPDAEAVVAIDDTGVEVAAAASAVIGLEHNPRSGVGATRDKLAMRRMLHASGVSQPRFAPAGRGEVADVASAIGYPAVVKPISMSASRGVIRVDGPRQASIAEERIRWIFQSSGSDPDVPLLVEEYLPGDEVVVEGVLSGGELEVLAILDKPDPLEGPFFEETMFVTPSRHSDARQAAAVRLAGDTTKALGLLMGPVHAELRFGPDDVGYVLEVAARPIGGLCGRSLSFGLLGESLEVAVLRNALGEPSLDRSSTRPASGVLMLPIPATGTLTAVSGLDEARAIEGVDNITITVPQERSVTALPEGDRYLGFAFASGPTPDEVEATLRRVQATLTVTVDGEDVSPFGGV